MSRMSKWVAAAVVAVAGLTVTAQTASAGDSPVAKHPPGPFPPGLYPPGPFPPGPFPPGPFPPGPFPPGGPGYDVDFVVYVKCHHTGRWKFYGKFETYHQAQRVEWMLERQGCAAMIKRVPGGRPYPW